MTLSLAKIETLPVMFYLKGIKFPHKTLTAFEISPHWDSNVKEMGQFRTLKIIILLNIDLLIILFAF